jgi:hypothetical protein
MMMMAATLLVHVFMYCVDKVKICFIHDADNEMMTTVKSMTVRVMVMVEVKKMT